MNGQKPEKTDWAEVIEDLQIRIHNGEIQIILFQAQLDAARKNI